MHLVTATRLVLAALLALVVHARLAQAGPRTGDGESTTISFRIGGQDRRAIVVNEPADGLRRPAVIVLHGGMGSADDMQRRSGFDPLARTNGFIVAYGEGTEFRPGMHAWNTGHLLRRQVRDADDIAYLDGLIDRLVADHGADPARIFMTGGSNGGMMTFVYAVARPERLAAAAPVVASMFSFDAVPAVPLPILIINGAKDEEVPLAGGLSGNALVRGAQATPFKPVREVVDFWVKANRSRPEAVTQVAGTVTTATYAAGPGGAVTEFVLDAAGGHGWPGTPARREGNSPIAAFPGAERVWAFFADRRRPPADDAKRAVEVLDFPDLVDAARGAAPGRRVPITVHLPSGPGPSPLPTIVVSHGAGGDRDTHFGQAQDLAAHGYAVLCVEHVGSNRARLTQGLRPMRNLDAMVRDADEALARPRDVSFVLDQATAWNAGHERMRGKFDLRRVGVLGHSYGAFTVLVVCGVRPALDWFEPRIEPGKGLGPDLHDPRVRCGVALSPQGVGEPFFIEASFASVRVPVLGISGTKDAQQEGRPAEGRKEAFALWPAGEHRLVWLANARHGDFTSASGATGRSLPSPTRDDAQPVVRAATRAWFDLHLTSEPAAADQLTEAGLKPFLRGEIDRVEVLGPK